MIDDIVLRWVVTGLSALSAAAWGFAVVGRHRSWPEVIRCGLHFVMAIAMVVMIWPWGAQLPATEPVVFVSVAALWFLTLALVPAETLPLRAVCGYHASRYPHMDMDMADGAVPTSAGPPGWIAAMNSVWFVGFVVAAAFWTSGFGVKRPDGSTYGWCVRSTRRLKQRWPPRCLSRSAPRYFRPEPIRTSQRYGHPSAIPQCAMSTGD